MGKAGRNVLYYICFSALISLCLSKRPSLKFLKEQLRVIKEAHALDMKALYDEIDSIKVDIEELSAVINSTEMKKDDDDAITRDPKNDRNELELDNSEETEAFMEKFERFVALQNGFKSFKAWHIRSLRILEGSISNFEKNMELRRGEIVSRVEMLQQDLHETNQHFLHLQGDITSTQQDLYKAKQMINTVEDSCSAEIERHGTSVETRVSKIQDKFETIYARGWMYSVKEDEWTVLFRAQAGNGIRVYDAWESSQGTRDSLPADMMKYTDRHYRNPLVDSWNTLRVALVRLALYENGREVAFLLFDGVGTDKMNWFSKERILDSSWNHLRYDSPLNFASVAGDGRYGRRFFINIRYGGCENDHGFIVLEDCGTQPCSYEKNPQQPQILYSRFPGGTRWQSMLFGSADYMVISVKHTAM